MSTKSPTPDVPPIALTGEPVALPKDVLDALRFYAHGHHYSIDDDHQQFDTVSGEPANWMFSEKDDDCTMFEDGGIARAVLLGRSAGFEEPVEPVESEVFFAAPTPSTQAAGEPVAWIEQCEMEKLSEAASVRFGVTATLYPEQGDPDYNFVPLYAAPPAPQKDADHIPQARDEVIEECAKACEAWSAEVDAMNKRNRVVTAAMTGALSCAAAIRALTNPSDER